jgi:hypothetical protein
VGSEHSAAERVYLAAKLIADTATVDLLGWGIFTGGGGADRVEALRATRPEAGDLERVESWSSWRIVPRWESTPLGLSVAESAVSGRLAEEVQAAARAAILFVTGQESVARFLSFPQPQGRPWARAWKRWLRMPDSSIRRIGFGRLRGTPRLLLWEAALEWLVGDRSRAEGLLGRLNGGGAKKGQTLELRLLEVAKMMDREGID